jgi:hypothetical protein
MAPIEHAWDALGRRVDNRPVKPTTGATLRQALLEEWNNMPQTVIQNVILPVIVIQLTFCACKKFIETLAVCGRALSCWKILKS